MAAKYVVQSWRLIGHWAIPRRNQHHLFGALLLIFQSINHRFPFVLWHLNHSFHNRISSPWLLLPACLNCTLAIINNSPSKGKKKQFDVVMIWLCFPLFLAARTRPATSHAGVQLEIPPSVNHIKWENQTLTSPFVFLPHLPENGAVLCWRRRSVLKETKCNKLQNDCLSYCFFLSLSHVLTPSPPGSSVSFAPNSVLLGVCRNFNLIWSSLFQLVAYPCPSHVPALRFIVVRWNSRGNYGFVNICTYQRNYLFDFNFPLSLPGRAVACGSTRSTISR